MYINDKEHLCSKSCLTVKFFLSSLCFATAAPQNCLVIKYWHPGWGKRDPEKLSSLWSLSSSQRSPLLWPYSLLLCLSLYHSQD